MSVSRAEEKKCRQKQPPEVFYKNFAKFVEKTPVSESLF